MAIAAVAGQTVSPDLISVYGQKNEDEAPDNGLGKDAFLKLLVAQLKYQDPMNPSSSEDFIATTAQFTLVEKLDELTELTRSNGSTNALTTASALIGKEITVKGQDGKDQTALVERTELVNGEVMVITRLGTVGLDQIIGIGAPGSGTDAEATTDTDAMTNDSESTTTDSDAETAIDTETTTDTSTESTDSQGTGQDQEQEVTKETTGTDANETPVSSTQDATNETDVSSNTDTQNAGVSDDASTVTDTPVSTKES